MPRNPVTRTFQKAGSTPSRRVRDSVIPLDEISVFTLREPQGVSPLVEYIEENRDTGISVQELIEQFQEYDCEHMEVRQLASNNNKIIHECRTCFLITVEEKEREEAA